MQKEKTSYVFRVEIWFEATDTQSHEHEWRGNVKELETGKSAYFRKLRGFEDAVKKFGVRENICK